MPRVARPGARPLRNRYDFFHKVITNPSLFAQIRPGPLLASQLASEIICLGILLILFILLLVLRTLFLILFILTLILLIFLIALIPLILLILIILLIFLLILLMLLSILLILLFSRLYSNASSTHAKHFDKHFSMIRSD